MNDLCQCWFTVQEQSRGCTELESQIQQLNDDFQLNEPTTRNKGSQNIGCVFQRQLGLLSQDLFISTLLRAASRWEVRLFIDRDRGEIYELQVAGAKIHNILSLNLRPEETEPSASSRAATRAASTSHHSLGPEVGPETSPGPSTPSARRPHAPRPDQ